MRATAILQTLHMALGIKYATKIVIDSSGPEADAPIFCEIELVFICEKNKLFFIIKSLDIDEFCSRT